MQENAAIGYRFQGGGPFIGETKTNEELSFAQQLLQLVLGQKAVVLHKGRDLWRSLCLIVHSAVDFHVLVENLQETFLTLLGEEGKQTVW